MRRLLAAPRYVGSITPSSRYLVRSLVQFARDSRFQTIVELGPGTGPFTGELLTRLSTDGRLVCVERDPLLAEHLRTRFSDPRLSVVSGEAEHLGQYLSELHLEPQVPLIVSGLPFTSLPSAARHNLLATIVQCLTPDGQLLLYQYSVAIRPLLRRYFKEVETRWEFRNVPPAVCIRCLP